MKKFIFLFLCLIAGFTSALAGEHPQAHFGEFGLQHFPSADGYQQYVGQTVVYLPEQKPSYDDKQFSELFKGQFGVEYIIQKVSGDAKKSNLKWLRKTILNQKSNLSF